MAGLPLPRFNDKQLTHNGERHKDDDKSNLRLLKVNSDKKCLRGGTTLPPSTVSYPLDRFETQGFSVEACHLGGRLKTWEWDLLPWSKSNILEYMKL